MKKMIGMIGILMAFALVLGTVGAAGVSAAESDGRIAATPKKVTGLRVTGFTTPVGGVPFAKGVTVTTAEGISWGIPVTWIDTEGKVVTVPETGKKYIPTFVLYIPGGYTVDDTVGGHINVSFPSVFAPDGFVYSFDPATQITYITYAGGIVAQAPSGTDPTKPAQEEEKKSSDSDDDDEGFDPVSTYCDDTAINTLSNDFLEWLLDKVINVIQPQAVKMLKEGFPESLGKAKTDDDISSEMGLYVYYKTGKLDGKDFEPGSLAFVEGKYLPLDSNNPVYKLYMAVDASSFAEVNAKTGEWYIPEGEKKALFTSTIVHEMMHGFMDDYTRTGMMSVGDNEFPVWFVEGIAATVDNTYHYRDDTYNELTAQGAELTYTKESIYNRYTKEHGPGSRWYDIGHSGYNVDGGNEASAYVMGSLATIYLGYMYATNVLDEQVIDEKGNVNIAGIRRGIDNILLDLHNNNTLDAVIKDASGGKYATTADFQNKFVKGEGEDENGGSLAFVTEYLNWMDSQNFKDDQGKDVRANGSILRQEQNYLDPMEGKWDEEVHGQPYHIAEQHGWVESTADDIGANLTGGKIKPGDGTHDYIFVPDDQNKAAAKDVMTVTAADLAATVVLPDSTPAVEKPAPADDSAASQTPAVTTAPNEQTPAVRTAPGEQTSEKEDEHSSASSSEHPTDDSANKAETKTETETETETKTETPKNEETRDDPQTKTATTTQTTTPATTTQTTAAPVTTTQTTTAPATTTQETLLEPAA